MISFDQFWKNLKTDLAELLRAELALPLKVSSDAAAEIIGVFQDDLKEWYTEISAGRASTDDFEWTMKTKMEAAEISALTQLGLTKIKRDKIVNGLIQIGLSNILKVPGF